MYYYQKKFKYPNNMMDTCIVWLRKDLRLHDNPALFEATKNFKNVIPVYIHDSEFGGDHKISEASKCWLHHSLSSFINSQPLVLRAGCYLDELKKLVQETGATHLYFNESFVPTQRDFDESLESHLDANIQTFPANLLMNPTEVFNLSNQPYKVFTPFWKKCILSLYKKALAPTPSKIDISSVKTFKLDDLNLLPNSPDWSKGIVDRWEIGENTALEKFHQYVQNDITEYSVGRNLPAKDLVSFMSPHLAFGEISVNYMYNYIMQNQPSNCTADEKKSIQTYISELGWREFSYYLLHHFPHLPYKNFKENFNGFEWDRNQAHLEAWQKGLTGYPIVDAGMRELWHTGYMHNRVRMIVGSFLVKDLHIDWREGEKWFWNTLVDADIASNSASWQWVAGSGADAAPYFRIFNPITQGERFDTEGEYVKRWVPELSNLDSKYIHKPFEAPPLILKSAGVTLGADYPYPIVNHKREREVAMEKYNMIKTS